MPKTTVDIYEGVEDHDPCDGCGKQDCECEEETELAESLAMIDRSMEDIRAGRTQPAKQALRKIANELKEIVQQDRQDALGHTLADAREWLKHVKTCDCTCCHHDFWSPAPHLLGDKDCRCRACIEYGPQMPLPESEAKILRKALGHR